jgi:SAM-dependent methyltransferase
MWLMRLAEDPGRQRALSFGRVADDYHQTRPSYPAGAVRWLLGRDPLEVADLGAGTGKLTALLVDDGHRPIAVEPDAAMRAKFAAVQPGVRSLDGWAEAIPLPDDAVDAVVAGQAFHWFDVEPALDEILRILRPGGTLGIIWNFRSRSEEWMGDLAAMAGQDGLPDGWLGRFEALPRVAGVDHRSDVHVHPVGREALVRLVGTWSPVAVLEEAERQEVLGRVRELWDRRVDLARVSRVPMTYECETYRVRLT